MARKAEAIQHWRSLESDQPILRHFTPIPYKASGSKYGTCGIRIDGSPQFVDAVLSRLQDLIDGENHATRLELSRRSVTSEFKAMPNAVQDSEVCYIRLHMRGGQAATLLFDRSLDDATERFAKAQS
jgi:hypothetical protein